MWGSPDGPVWACHTLPVEVGLAITRLADEHGWELVTTVGAITYWRQRPGQPLGQATPNEGVAWALRELGVTGSAII